MRKIKYIFTWLVLFMMIFPIVNISANDNIENEYFTALEDVDTNDVYDHSYFAFGNKIDSSAVINGIFFAAGNSLKLNSSSEYGMFAGNIITIDNVIEKDLFVAGNDITISKSAAIGRDVFIAGNNVDIEANINGNIFIAANEVIFKNVTIDGNVDIDCNVIKFVGSVTINGTLKYNDDVQIGGSDNLTAANIITYDAGSSANNNFISTLTTNLFSIIGLIIVGIALIFICPKLFDVFEEKYSINTIAKNLLLGICVLVLMPLISFILLFSVVGVQLSIIGFIVYGIFIYLSVIPTSVFIGNLILTDLLKKANNKYLELIIGVFVIKLLSLIPIIGSVIYVLAILIGLGLIYKMITVKRH